MRLFYLCKYLGLLLGLIAMPGLSGAADSPLSPDDLQSYALRLRVTPAPNATVQRLVVPAQALVQLKSADYRDIRLFNAEGQVAPMALLAPRSLPTEAVNVPLYPLWATSALSAVQWRDMQSKKKIQNSRPVMGALLDVRFVKAAISGLRLEVDFPANQAVNMAIEASTDLKEWRVLTRTMLYRSGVDNEKNTTAAVASKVRQAARANFFTHTLSFDPSDLPWAYVRLTWEHAAVKVHRVSVLTASPGTPRRVSVAVVGPQLSNSHELQLHLPFAIPVAALKVIPQGENVWLPVKVWGRKNSKLPWQLLAQRVVFRTNQNDQEASADSIELPVLAGPEIKIEAESQTPGFLTAPDLSFEFEAVQIVFLTGQSSLILGAGSSELPAAWLPIASLLPGYQPGEESSLPAAQVDITSAPALSWDSLSSLPHAALKNKRADSGKPTQWWSIVAWGALAMGMLSGLLLLRARQGIE